MPSTLLWEARGDSVKRLPRPRCEFVHVRPRGRPGESDHLFHSNGDGTFTDVSKKAAVDDPQGYYGLASVFVDVDDDGWLDLQRFPTTIRRSTEMMAT